MAIIVLRRGDSIFPLDVTCLYCGSVLRIESPADLIIKDILPDKVPYFACPVCNKQSALYEADRAQALFEYFKLR